MGLPEGRPDGAIYPESFKAGKRASDRYKSLVMAGEELLQIDASKGEKVFYRKMPHLGGKCFATKSILDSYLFHTGHSLSGMPRYDWYPHPSEPDVQLGWLVPEGREEEEERNAKEAARAR